MGSCIPRVSLAVGPHHPSQVGIPIPDTAPLLHASLAGVSRSTTILVAYLMTVTELSWESCLAATKAVRSYVSPNFGFQQQLQEYEVTLLQEVGPAPTSAYIRVRRVCKQTRLFCMQLAAGASCLPELVLLHTIYCLGILGFACKQKKKRLKKKNCLDIMQAHLKKLFKTPVFFLRVWVGDGGRNEGAAGPLESREGC